VTAAWQAALLALPTNTSFRTFAPIGNVEETGILTTDFTDEYRIKPGASTLLPYIRIVSVKSVVKV
jgi:hypothetical protein